MRQAMVRRLSRFYESTLLCLLLTATAGEVWACDPCALFASHRAQHAQAGAFSAGVSQQFTSYSKVKDSSNLRSGEISKSLSTTLASLTYDWTERLSSTVVLPLIYRRFDQVKKFRSSSETETGLGDAVLLVSYSPLAEWESDRSYSLSLVGGIKLPTGDSGSIKTVAESVEEEEAHSARGAFDDLLPAVMHLPSSAGGGRALSLGSGSVDYIVGTTASARFDRLLISSVVQFTQRTEGDFDYRFANDLLWSFGPGFYLILEDRLTLALLFPVSGEHKGRDSLGSSIEKGTHLSNIYLGPELVLTAFDSLLAALSFDLPVSSDTAAAIVETDYRVRLSLNYRF